MKTVILSPTQTILRQTGETIERLTPQVQASNFYAAEKDLFGQVLNTTYPSFLNLLENGQIDPREVELLICDEAHTGLGEERHKLYRQLPNALMIGLTATPFFSPLSGYERRGIVGKSERWTGLFRKQIHEMGLEEAIQRGILAQLDVHLVKTNVSLENVEVLSTGEYNQRQLERYLNTEARNYLTVGMLAGADRIPEGLNLSDRQRKEISEIHNKINGKQTAIFAISIAHAEHLVSILKNEGLKAEAIHSRVSLERRQEILNDYGRGELQVILGVDMLRLGWDSPETEVGVYLAPTYSGIVAVQELGRILRTSEKTGKENAIAIQCVDEFKFRGQAPVLIPNIFDPYYVLRGTQTGDIKASRQQIEKKEKEPITFSGLGVETIVEEAFTNQLLKERFRQGTILEMSSIIDRVIYETLEKYPEISTIEFYKLLEKNIPRISLEKQNEALQAVASIDSNVSGIGKKVLLFTNLGTIFSAIEPYLENEETENSEIVQEAICEVYSKLDKHGRKLVLSHDIYYLAQDGISKYISRREGMPFTWVKDRKHKMIACEVDRVLNRAYGDLSENEVWQLASNISEETGISVYQISDFILGRERASQFLGRLGDVSEEFEVPDENLKRYVKDVLESLSHRERRVIEFRFGIDDGVARTLEEVGDIFQVTRERIRSIEAKALSKIRRPSRSKRLKDFLDLPEKRYLIEAEEWPSPEKEEYKSEAELESLAYVPEDVPKEKVPIGIRLGSKDMRRLVIVNRPSWIDEVKKEESI